MKKSKLCVLFSIYDYHIVLALVLSLVTASRDLITFKKNKKNSRHLKGSNSKFPNHKRSHLLKHTKLPPGYRTILLLYRFFTKQQHTTAVSQSTVIQSLQPRTVTVATIVSFSVTLCVIVTTGIGVTISGGGAEGVGAGGVGTGD